LAAPATRRQFLAAASVSLAAVVAALLAGCGRPTFDRDRGVFVFRRPAK